jgi:hypothetical protein
MPSASVNSQDLDARLYVHADVRGGAGVGR